MTPSPNRRALAAVLLATLTGCGPANLRVTDLTARERAVEVFQRGEKPACEYDGVGIVEATSGTAVTMGAYESTMAELQRKAAALGATGVLILDHSKSDMVDQATGKAIRCKPAAPSQ